MLNCRIIIFQGHYSLIKGAMFLGIGAKSVVMVESDQRGRMKPDALDLQITNDIEKVSGIYMY